MPAQVIIVDGGDISLDPLSFKPLKLGIDYVRKTPASLTAQRNAGIRNVRADISIICFLDDDIVLEYGSLGKMMDFWERAAEDVGGASFNNMGDRYTKPGILQKIFLTSSDTPGRILASGFQSKLSSLDKTTQVEWLVGCAMTYRKRVFDEFIFDEWYSGYARYEDVDFSYSVGRKYKMFVVAEAKVQHPSKPEDISFSSALGKMEVVNRLYFVRKHKNLSVVLCYWSILGVFLNNVLRGALLTDARCLERAKGNLAGLLAPRK